MTGNGHNTQEELASYAMQGLPPEESASIRAHLQTCAQCRTELAQVCGDLALLGLAVDQQPLPEGARDRFLQRIASSPVVKPQEKLAEVTPIEVKTKRRGAGFWVPWMTAAAMAIAAVSLGVQNKSKAQQVLEVLTAPSAQRVTLTEGKAPPEPSARATYLPDRGALILLATNLKPLPEGKAYELWVIPASGKAPVPAGVFRPDSVGTATLVLPSLPTGIAAKAFGVTIEKASGADSPTSPIILSGATGS